MRRSLLVLGMTLCGVRAASPAVDEEAPASQPAASQPAVVPRAFDLEELRFDLGFDADARRRRVISGTGGRYPMRFRQLNEDWRFAETVGLRTSGNVLDERVMRYDVSARWGLTQESFFEQRPGPDRRHEPHGDILNYDVKLDFLPAGKISGNAYASQVDDRIPRRFLPSLDRRHERYGAGLFFNDRTLPMRLTWERAFERLSSPLRGFADDEDRRDDTLLYEATWQPTEYHSLRLSYEYDQREEKFSGTGTRFDTTRNYATLDHTLKFGDQHRHVLETLARFQDETGDLARDTYEISPQLRLQHTDSLASTYKLQYLRESFAELGSELWRGDLGLAHQLGQSLTSNVNVYGLSQQTDERGGGRGGGTESVEWGANAGAAFSRENRLGRFSANLTYGHTGVRTDDGRRDGIVVAEAVTFHDPLPSYLAQTDVVRQSIVVTDAGRSRSYLAGRDYVVVQSGRYTALGRVRSGQIADLQTVLVSYTYRARNNFELSRDRIDLRIQQDFRFGLTPYYAGSIQDEDLDDSRFQTFRARNVNRHRLGATFRQRRWSLGLEYETHDDAIDPYEALHANADAVLLEDARQQLSSNVTASRFLFRGSGDLPEHDTTLLDLGVRYRCVLGQNLEANASASYRYEDDSLFGRTHGVDVTASLAYQIGLFSLLLEAEYDLLNLPTSSDETIAVWLKLRRDIPVFARRER